MYWICDIMSDGYLLCFILLLDLIEPSLEFTWCIAAILSGFLVSSFRLLIRSFIRLISSLVSPCTIEIKIIQS